MPRKINTFSNGGFLEFDKGDFDDWCVFVSKPNRERFAPKDATYFRRLKKIAASYGNRKMYDDFVVIYNRTTQQVNPDVFELITVISRNYGDYELELEIWFSVLYAGMIAEENKKHAILKKRIKRLGMYQVLLEQIPPEKAAIYSKGKKWHELDTIMKDRGF